MEIEVEEIDGNGKRTRKTRKLTNWSFVDRIDNNSSYCKCGCLDADGFDRKKLVTPTSGAITPHVKKKHPELWSMKTQLKINRGNLNQLLEKIEELNGGAVAKAKRQRRGSQKFWLKSIDLEPKVISELKLLLWSISNGISRNAINDPLFDSYIRSLGAEVAPNRHTLQSQHLPILDELVRYSYLEDLKEIPSVALSSDGWRDRHRRDWINRCGIYLRFGGSKELDYSSHRTRSHLLAVECDRGHDCLLN